MAQRFANKYYCVDNHRFSFGIAVSRFQELHHAQRRARPESVRANQ
jgi:hypothetical protein